MYLFFFKLTYSGHPSSTLTNTLESPCFYSICFLRFNVLHPMQDLKLHIRHSDISFEMVLQLGHWPIFLDNSYKLLGREGRVKGLNLTTLMVDKFYSDSGVLTLDRTWVIDSTTSSGKLACIDLRLNVNCSQLFSSARSEHIDKTTK